MIDLKSAVMGTSDPRALLQQIALHAWDKQAGYVAPVLTEDDGLPVIKFGYVCNESLYAWSEYEGTYYNVGRLVQVVLDAKLCDDCRQNITDVFYPHFYIRMVIEAGELCECCSEKFVDIFDDVPF